MPRRDGDVFLLGTAISVSLQDVVVGGPGSRNACGQARPARTHVLNADKVGLIMEGKLQSWGWKPSKSPQTPGARWGDVDSGFPAASHSRIDHVHDFGSIRSKIIVI
jgi:hypothetical protein